MAYSPLPVYFAYSDVSALARYVLSELQRIAEQLNAVDTIQLKVLHVEPTKPRNGMIVLADGSDWNPGSGAGFYGRSNDVWVLLG